MACVTSMGGGTLRDIFIGHEHGVCVCVCVCVYVCVCVCVCVCKP